MPRLSLSQQIQEVEHQLARANAEAAKSVRAGKLSAADARMHALRLEAVLHTLRLIVRFEGPVRSLLANLLQRDAATAAGVQGTPAPSAAPAEPTRAPSARIGQRERT